jgi:hypothetical protein
MPLKFDAVCPSLIKGLTNYDNFHFRLPINRLFSASHCPHAINRGLMRNQIAAFLDRETQERVFVVHPFKHVPN